MQCAVSMDYTMNLFGAAPRTRMDAIFTEQGWQE